MSQTGLRLLSNIILGSKTTQVLATEAMGTKSKIEAVACACHELCRAVARADGDREYPHWADATEDNRETTRKSVIYLQTHPEADAGAIHKVWMDDRIADGWVYGETKDAEAKTHPCLVEYEELPLIEKIKDHIFLTVVRQRIEKASAD